MSDCKLVVGLILVTQILSGYAQCPGGYSLAPTGQTQFCAPLSPTQTCQSPYQCLSGFCCSPSGVGTSSFCPIGTTAYVVGVNGQAQQCNNQQLTCPSPYNCYVPNLSAIGYCCTSSPLNIGQVCPTGSTQFLVNNAAQTCNPSLNLNCPSSYTCYQPVAGQTGYCCTPVNSLITPSCPGGGQALYSNLGIAQQCTVGYNNVCPTGYGCLSTTNGATGFCCPVPCPTGSTYQQTNNVVATCVAGQTGSFGTGCSNGFACTVIPGSAIGICCSTGTVSSQCPNNGIPYNVGTVPYFCTVNQYCPTGYNCVTTSIGGTVGSCCPSATCPNNGLPYNVNGVYTSCIGGGTNSCPSGFSCSATAIGTTGLCCQSCVGSSCGTCINGGIPYTVSNNIQSCLVVNGITLQGCPTGYTCSNSICCTTPTSTQCPNNASPFLNNGASQACTVSYFNSCPNGYTCLSPTNSATGICCLATCPMATGIGNLVLNNGVAQACQVGGINTCSSPAVCTSFYNSGVTTAYCCTASSVIPLIGQCSAGSTATIDPTTGNPLICGQSAPSLQCPTNYYCVQSTAPNVYVCCSGAQNAQCPNGLSGYYSSTSGTSIQTCSFAGAIGQCPSPYNCVQSTLGTSFLCCSGGSVGSCPAGSTPYINPSTQQLQTCTALGSFGGCPLPSTCVQSATGGSLVCCNTPTFCPAGTTPYINPTTGQTQTCTQLGAFGGCPTPSTCTQALSSTALLCCSNPTAVRCPSGANPFQGTQGQTYNCAGLTCPDGYQCTSVGTQQMCCPNNPIIICTLQSDPGVSCASAAFPSTVYSFNPQTRSCNSVQFSGCGGNGNNFDTQNNCQNYCGQVATCQFTLPLLQGFGSNPMMCASNSGSFVTPGTSGCPIGSVCTNSLSGSGSQICCPTPGNVCEQPFNSGTNCPPGASSTRYYYDINSDSCRQFTYTGCGGNYNNFGSINDCQTFCSNTDFCVAGDPILSSPNSLLSNFPCSVSASCPSTGQYTYQCISAGTTGLFGTNSITSSLCCPSAASVCNQPMQSGDSNCGIQINSQRFYYNPTSQSCQPFTFNGCNGNFNNFLQLQDCQSLCGTTIQPTIPTPVIIQPQCPSGSFPYLSGFGQTQSCTPGIVNTCNTGYVCQLASTSTFGFPSYICCSTTNFPLSLTGYCSQGSNPYVTGTTVPQSCIPSAACPTGFTCQYSYSLRQYYCCSQPFTSVLTGQSNTVSGCPFGTAYLSNGIPQKCIPGVFGTCPTSPVRYSCTYSFVNRQNQCCSGGSVSFKQSTGSQSLISSSNSTVKNT